MAESRCYTNIVKSVEAIVTSSKDSFRNKHLAMGVYFFYAENEEGA